MCGIQNTLDLKKIKQYLVLSTLRYCFNICVWICIWLIYSLDLLKIDGIIPHILVIREKWVHKEQVIIKQILKFHELQVLLLHPSF